MPILEHIISLMAPHECLLCGNEGALLCAWCLPDSVPEIPSRCYRCYRATVESAVCPACRRTSSLKHVWVRGEYGGVSKKLIHLLKFQRAKAASQTVANLMQSSLPYLPEQITVAHVPAATSRVRTRGYDQAQLLASELSRKLGRRQLTLLARHGQSRQVGARRAERLKQMDNVFSCSKTSVVKNAHILLVDDVVTTGATLEAAARTLKSAGAKTVSAVVFSQRQ